MIIDMGSVPYDYPKVTYDEIGQTVIDIFQSNVPLPVRLT